MNNTTGYQTKARIVFLVCLGSGFIYIFGILNAYCTLHEPQIPQKFLACILNINQHITYLM